MSSFLFLGPCPIVSPVVSLPHHLVECSRCVERAWRVHAAQDRVLHYVSCSSPMWVLPSSSQQGLLRITPEWASRRVHDISEIVSNESHRRFQLAMIFYQRGPLLAGNVMMAASIELMSLID
jgi:hypothetical protein